METPNVTAVLNQLLVRYRRGAVLHVGLSAGLGLGCVGLVAWRLWLGGVSRPVLEGVGVAGLLGVTAWQWRFLRRERLNRRQLVAQLDETLGLKARLLTAVEFADAPEPPALYARLLEETTKSLPAAFRRLPPVVDRRIAALAAVLLLLWLWPRSSARLTQLAMSPTGTMHPASVMPPPELPPTEPGTPAASFGEAKRAGVGDGSAETRSVRPTDQDQHQDRSSREPSPSSSGQSGQAGQQDSTRNSSQSGAQSSGSQDSHGSQASQASPSQSDRGSQPDARQAQQQSSPQAKASSGSQDQGRQGTPQKQPQASASGSQQQTSGSQQREQSGRSGQTGQAQAKAAAAQDRDAAARESGPDTRISRSGQQAGSSAQQELLKGDIQQLLKELSTELKQMQTELEAAQRHDQPNPMPGTSTDPNLYGDSAQAKQAAGNRLPVQLEVDTQPTASTRRGGGVGKPSTEIADTLPQQQPEEANLSDVRTTEAGVAPQSIPPEYRPVFERLSRQ